MTLTLTFLALTIALSFGILLFNILTAQEGYQDESGFHTGTPSEQIYATLAGSSLKPVFCFCESIDSSAGRSLIFSF